MRTLEQRRAHYAWMRIETVSEGDKGTANDVAMYLKGMPAMVLANGLGQSLAFMLSKAKGNEADAHYIVYDMIAEWLVDRRNVYGGPKAKLMLAIIEGDRATYQQAQEETWALLVWLKKFADAYIRPNAAGANGQTGAKG